MFLAGSVRSTASHTGILWLGALFQVLACALALYSRMRDEEPIGSVAIMLYVIALGWLTLGAPGLDCWFLHLSLSVLLMVPLLLFATQCLKESGAPALRRARQLAQRLANRKDWPASLHACRLLPEDAPPCRTTLSKAFVGMLGGPPLFLWPPSPNLCLHGHTPPVQRNMRGATSCNELQ